MRPYLEEFLAGHGALAPFGALVVLGALVFLVASRLAHDADAIADESGLGGLWVGSLLLAVATSLPEVLTDVNAVVLGAPDIGAGDLFGSTMANMTILATVSLLFRRRRVFERASERQAAVGLLAILLTLIAALGIVLRGALPVGFLGFESLLLLLVYIGGMRAIWQAEEAERSGPGLEGRRARRRLWNAGIGFGFATLVLVFLTPMLVISAEIFASESGLTQTFVGTLLIGLTTSFPEMSAVIAAVRMGAIDLAVGDIFGSNAFNMLVFLFMDLFHLDGPILAVVSQSHLFTALLALGCLSLGVFALVSRGRRREGAFPIESLLILITYAGGLALLSRMGE